MKRHDRISKSRKHVKRTSLTQVIQRETIYASVLSRTVSTFGTHPSALSHRTFSRDLTPVYASIRVT